MKQYMPEQLDVLSITCTDNSQEDNYKTASK